MTDHIEAVGSANLPDGSITGSMLTPTAVAESTGIDPVNDAVASQSYADNAAAAVAFDPTADESITGTYSFSKPIHSDGLATTATVAYDVDVVGDTQKRLEILGDGTIKLGDGATPSDVSMYYASSTLRFDAAAGYNFLGGANVNFAGPTLHNAAIRIEGSGAKVDHSNLGSEVNWFTGQKSSESSARFLQSQYGKMEWGIGSNYAPDVTVQHSGTWFSRLDLAGNFWSSGASSTDPAIAVGALGDANPLTQIRGDGQIKMGPGGGGAADVTWYRSGAGQARIAATTVLIAGGVTFEDGTITVDGTGATINFGSDGNACTLFRSGNHALNFGASDFVRVSGGFRADGSTQLAANSGALGFYNTTPIAQPSAVTAPSGGAVIDSQSRTAIQDIITLLHNYGLTA